jgi:hypothetical protein
MKRFSFPFLFVAVLAGCLSVLPPATAQSAATLNSVATAGKQRMLSQRALKAYVQLLLNVMPEKATTILAASLDELKSNNAALRTVAKDSNLAALQAQATLIDRLAAVTTSPPSANFVQQAAQVSEDLLNNAEAVTQGFAKSGAEAPAAMVNLAARQRMLSQRAASAYLAYQTAAKSPELKARAIKAIGDFRAAINAFDDAKTEFPQIAERIDMTRLQMVFFENAMSNIDSPTKEQFTTVATTSERILSEMDLMTADMVKQLAARSSNAATVVAKKK